MSDGGFDADDLQTFGMNSSAAAIAPSRMGGILRAVQQDQDATMANDGRRAHVDMRAAHRGQVAVTIFELNIVRSESEMTSTGNDKGPRSSKLSCCRAASVT